MNQYIAAFEKHRLAAELSYSQFRSWVRKDLPRVPGMDTIIRLAWRVECGHDTEQAACREYLYRWRLALGTPDQIALGGKAWLMFGAPHLFGM